MAIVPFKNNSEELYLAVGTAKDLQLTPRSLSSAFIHIYRFTSNHTSLQLFHKTAVSDPVLALCTFQNKILAGVGKCLRLYDLGKLKLLRKCENKNFPTAIQSIAVYGDRIYVGDLCEAFQYVKYKKAEKQFYVFADNTAPRYLTSSCVIDYESMAGADKFGNIFVSRLPPEVSATIADDPTAPHVKFASGSSGSSHKLTDIVQFHVGEMVTCLQKTPLVPGGAEVILYSTMFGGLGILVPFVSREDVDFFSHLEMHLRQESPPLCGRDHLAFRSAYFPVKDVIDIDLCEQYATLEYDRQQAIAEELVCSPADVHKKLEELRNRVL